MKAGLRWKLKPKIIIIIIKDLKLCNIFGQDNNITLFNNIYKL